MAVRYSLNFDSESQWTKSDGTKARTEWELDILDEGFTGTPTKIKGQASPITIEWKRDRDMYAPIVGSRATINLLLEDGDTIEDFNDGSEYQWEVRLRYKDADDNLQDYWNGWINPNDGNERQGTYPLEVSYVATDGFGKLNYSVRKPNDRGNVLLLHYILDALEATGLGLDVYIDSSIRDENDADALTTVKVNELAFIDEDTSRNYGNQGFNADNVKETLEGILAAFNCTVKQSKGRFYIYNASLHTTKAKTWNVYEYKSADDSTKIDGTNYVPGTSVSETVANLTQELSSDQDNTNLYINNESLYFIPRYPYGSVEATPQKLRKINPITNSNFDAGSTGWTSHADSAVQNLTIGTQSGDDFADAGNVIKNTRNVNKKSIGSTDDIWFQTSDAGAQKISTKYPLDFSFDYYAEFENNGDISNTKRMIMRYALWAEFEENATSNALVNNGSLYPPNWSPTSTITNASYSTNKFFYNFSTNRWSPLIAGEPGLLSNSYGTIDTKEDGTWETVDHRIEALEGGTTYFGYSYWEFPDEQPKVYVRFFYPDVRNGSNGSRATANSGKIEVWFDNISLNPDFGDNPRPVFERVRPLVDDGVPYVGTLEYKPGVIGNTALDQQYYELLDTSDYWEEGDDVDTDDPSVLEKIVTNQKMKDWQDQFYAFEATLMNNSEHPISPIDIVNIDTTVTGSNLSTDYLAIIQGGVFDPKKNTFKMSMYSPNQTSGEYGTFYEHNVDLRASKPPKRDEINSYTLGFFLTATDDDNNAVTNGLYADKYWVQIHGKAGEVISQSFTVYPAEGYEIDGNLTLEDSSDNPAPDFATLTFNKIGTEVRVEVTLTMPEEDEYEEAHISGVVDELVGVNSKVIFSATDSLTNGSIREGTGQITEIGPVGSTDNFYFFLEPDSGREFTASTITATLNSVKDGNADTDTNVANVITSSDIDVIQSGDGCIVKVPFRYSDVSPVYAKLTFSGASTAKVTSSTVTFTISSAEGGDDTADFSIVDPPAIKGDPGEYFVVPFQVQPESGKFISEGSIDVTESHANIIRTFVEFGASESTVWVEGTLPSATGSATVTIDPTIVDSEESAELKTMKLSFTKPTNTTITNQSATKDIKILPGANEDLVVTLEADTGYQLDLDEDPTVPSGVSLEGKVPFGDYGVVEGIHYTFQLTGPTTDDTSARTITWGSDTVEDSNNKYTLRININSTDAFNAVTNKNFIEVPFSDADLGDADGTDRTFTLASADATMEYTAATDLGSVTTTNSTILNVGNGNNGNGNVSWAESNGVITVTIGSITLPSSAPVGGLVEVELGLSDAAVTSSKDATSSGTTITALGGKWLPWDDGVSVMEFRVIADGEWQMGDGDNLWSLTTPQYHLAHVSPNSGGAGTHTVTLTSYGNTADLVGGATDGYIPTNVWVSPKSLGTNAVYANRLAQTSSVYFYKSTMTQDFYDDDLASAVKTANVTLYIEE